MKERETRPTQNETEEYSLLERIRELESQTKRLRLALAALFALAVILYLVAMKPITIKFLRVERIEFVWDGEVVASISAAPTIGGFYGISINQKDGTPMVRIGLYARDSIAGLRVLDLLNSKGVPVTKLEVASNGTGGVVVCSEDGDLALDLGCTEYGGKLFVARRRWMGNPDAPAVALGVVPSGAGWIVTSDSLGQVVWRSEVR